MNQACEQLYESPRPRRPGPYGPAWALLPKDQQALVINDDMPAYDVGNDIMDTFHIVRRSDEEARGHYRTKRVILEIYDAMTEAIRTAQPYRTCLNPPPGPLTDAAGNFIPMAQWNPSNWPPHNHAPRPRNHGQA